MFFCLNFSGVSFIDTPLAGPGPMGPVRLGLKFRALISQIMTFTMINVFNLKVIFLVKLLTGVSVFSYLL